MEETRNEFGERVIRVENADEFWQVYEKGEGRFSDRRARRPRAARCVEANRRDRVRAMPALLIVLAAVAWMQPGFVLAQDEEPLDLSKYDAFLEPHVSESKPCSEAGGIDRFELCNTCRPMRLLVEDLDKSAKAIGLTRDRLQVTVESRLRAARLYTEDYAGHGLSVRVGVVRRSFGLTAEYFKRLSDPVTGETSIASTWQEVSFGAHGDNPGFIVQNLSEIVDKFLVEYLRVNEEDCPR